MCRQPRNKTPRLRYGSFPLPACCQLAALLDRCPHLERADYDRAVELNPYETPQADLIDPPPAEIGDKPDFLSQLIGTLTMLALFAVFLGCLGSVFRLLVDLVPNPQ